MAYARLILELSRSNRRKEQDLGRNNKNLFNKPSRSCKKLSDRLRQHLPRPHFFCFVLCCSIHFFRASNSRLPHANNSSTFGIFILVFFPPLFCLQFLHLSFFFSFLFCIELKSWQTLHDSAATTQRIPSLTHRSLSSAKRKEKERNKRFCLFFFSEYYLL